MLPSYARRENKRPNEILNEETYIPRKDEGFSIMKNPQSQSFGEPSTLESLNKAFSESNANRLVLDDVKNGKIGKTFKEMESYNLNILPIYQKTNDATLEEDWCEMNINTKEQVGSYKDRLGRTIPIIVEKIPPRQFSEPKPVQNNKSIELFTGSMPKEKKKEVVGYIPEREENSLTRYNKASVETKNRQLEGLGTNKNHSQAFNCKDTTREGYHGYNMKQGHENRARKLVDTNRSYYESYVVPLKGIDEDGQVPYSAEKTTKVENTLYKREMSLGDGSYNEKLEKRSVPVLSSAKVVIEARTGGAESNIVQSNFNALKHRVEKKEYGTYKSDGKKFVESSSVVIPQNNPSNRHSLLLNSKPGNKVFETQTSSIRSKTVSSKSSRDAFMVNGVEYSIPEHTECTVVSSQERELGEEDPELNTIFVQQTLDECRIEPTILLNNDSAIENNKVYGETGPNARTQYSLMNPTHRSKEMQNENNTKDIELKEVSHIRPKQLLGSNDATEKNTTFLDSNFYDQSRVNVPKEKQLINKELKNNGIHKKESFVSSHIVKSEINNPKSIGSQNINFLSSMSKHSHLDSAHKRPNINLNETDGQENSRLGVLKGFIQNVTNIIPQTLLKTQLTSGTEKTAFALPHLVNGNTQNLECSQPNPLREEIVQYGRMGVHGESNTLEGNRLDCNLVPSHAKRGLQNVDRLTSNVYGKRKIIRDNWLPGCQESKDSIRGENYRPPSAVSDAGSACIPEIEFTRDSVTRPNRC